MEKLLKFLLKRENWNLLVFLIGLIIVYRLMDSLLDNTPFLLFDLEQSQPVLETFGIEGIPIAFMTVFWPLILGFFLRQIKHSNLSIYFFLFVVLANALIGSYGCFQIYSIENIIASYPLGDYKIDNNKTFALTLLIFLLISTVSSLIIAIKKKK